MILPQGVCSNNFGHLGWLENLASKMYMLLSVCVTYDAKEVSPTEGTLIYLCLKKNPKGENIKILCQEMKARNRIYVLSPTGYS